MYYLNDPFLTILGRKKFNHDIIPFLNFYVQFYRNSRHKSQTPNVTFGIEESNNNSGTYYSNGLFFTPLIDDPPFLFSF